MIAIVDYGLGNLASITNTLDRLALPSIITSDKKIIAKSDSIILPGVGAAGAGMKNLKERGLDKILVDQINKGKSTLGICLGMQLLFSFSEEGNVDCLGVIEGQVKKFGGKMKVPQIGWNQIKCLNAECRMKDNNLFKNIKNNSYFYFVNSYYCVPEDTSVIVGTTDYGGEFCSLLVKDNIVATQFHPEKSGKIGQQLLQYVFEHFNDIYH